MARQEGLGALRSVRYLWAATLLGLLLLACDDEPGGDRSGAVDAESPSFSVSTTQAGLSEYSHETGARGEKWFPETMGSGCAFLDYNDDGHLDLLLAGGGFWSQVPPDGYRSLWLYRNEGDGSYTLTPRGSVIPELEAYTYGIYPADVDDDGDMDVFVTTLRKDLLLINRGGRFVERGEERGVAGSKEWTMAAAFFDADSDGDLDLYVGGYADWSPKKDLDCGENGLLEYCHPNAYGEVPSRYYENQGDGTFEQRSNLLGAGDLHGKVLGAVAIDFNRDGRIDLAVARDLEQNLLYMNEGGGYFSEEGVERGMAFSRQGDARAGMGIDADVVDSTRQVSLFVGNFSRETMGVFRYGRDGLFEERGGVTGLTSPSRMTLTFGLTLFDADGDGDQDLLAANGHIQELIETKQGVAYRQPPQLFVNNGAGQFRTLAARPGTIWRQPLLGRGVAYGDYDGDGDPDAVIVENGGGVHLLRNNGPSSRYVKLRLVGRESNPQGIGTRLRTKVGEDWRVQHVRGGASYLSTSASGVFVGTGIPGQEIDSLVISWPSGRTDHYGPVSPGTTRTLIEGGSSITSR